MKAAVVFQRDGMPVYVDNFLEPKINKDDEVLISVTASAIKHLDRSRASGKHYSVMQDLNRATVIGGDGVGIMEDGTRVYALGISGMIAERAVIEKDRTVKVPEALDDATAAALPNAVAGSAMALRFRANIQAGETVLINGATGFTGSLAVQIARHYGASTIIATGRDKRSLEALKELGADVLVLTTKEDDFVVQIKEIHKSTPIDVIVDYLWGHTAEGILTALKGEGSFTHRTRFISVGSLTGDKIQLSAEILRSVDIDLKGSGLGSWTKSEMKQLFSDIIPEMFQMAAEGKLKVQTEVIRIEDIAKLWERELRDGKRLVVGI